ncbi:MAG: GTPase HflX [Dehalococcoidales bacterium]|nr:GTPase HflX [Dehalococcoidales bacterium]
MNRRGVIRRGIDITQESAERALLVTVAAKRSAGRWSAEDSMAELAQLAGTAGVEVAGKLTQRLKAPSKTHYLGKGKLEELISLKDSTSYNVVIFDDELSPIQQRNLEEILKVKVIDRSALILDIFGRRAKTREGQLQVELAQHQYLLPRLAGQWSHLERLGGGIGTRGPGERQIETDRRLIRQKIHRLKAQLEEVRKHRALYRQRRKKSGSPVVAIVGYTNAGKSTLLNTLSQADVFVEDKLFATLGPITRRITLPDNRAVLITDTVGFIRKLPPTIVSSFRATLEELSEADILLHVVDLASHNAVEQCQTVEDILADLELADKPRITALNKIDLLLDRDKTWDEETAIKDLADERTPLDENTVLISAGKGWGLDRLLKLVSHALDDISHPSS